MRVGVVLPLFSGKVDLVLEAAHETESLGYDGAFVFDHFFPPGGVRDRPSLEAFATLSAVAAITERIAVGTLVARASLRPVGLLAKSAAWLDSASGGRLILGVGTGDATDRAEHDAYGVPLLSKRARRRHLEETVRALRALFDGKPYAGGTAVPAIEGPLAPPGVRPGGPPLWVGAHAEEVIRMAARLADGWNGWGFGVEAFARKAILLAEAAAEAERQVEATWAGIVVVGEDEAETDRLLERRRERGMGDGDWAGTPERLAGFLQQLDASGATWAILVPGGPRDRRALIAAEVLPRL